MYIYSSQNFASHINVEQCILYLMIPHILYEKSSRVPKWWKSDDDTNHPECQVYEVTLWYYETIPCIEKVTNLVI